MALAWRLGDLASKSTLQQEPDLYITTGAARTGPGLLASVACLRLHAIDLEE